MAAKNRVREARLREGLTQVQLASLADVTDRIISIVETGRRSVAPLTRGKIAGAFIRLKDPVYKDGYTYEYLFPDD